MTTTSSRDADGSSADRRLSDALERFLDSVENGADPDEPAANPSRAQVRNAALRDLAIQAVNRLEERYRDSIDAYAALIQGGADPSDLPISPLEGVRADAIAAVALLMKLHETTAVNAFKHDSESSLVWAADVGKLSVVESVLRSIELP